MPSKNQMDRYLGVEPKERPADSRLVETKTSTYTSVHWMPATGSDWTCPVCGGQFAKTFGEWSKVA